MANYYVRNTAAGLADGSSWANAYTSIQAALAARLAGDTFWVADDHAESSGANIVMTSLGTAAAPCRILCVNTHVTQPPTGLATSATVSTTGNVLITFAGFAYCYGISFVQGTGSASSTSMSFTNSNPLWWKLEKCALKQLSTGASSTIVLGTSAGGVDDCLVEFVDTQLQFGGVGQGFRVMTKFRWTAPTGVQPLIVGTIPTALFLSNNDAVGYSEIIGVDFSQLTAGKSLVTFASTSSHDYTFINCKLSTTGTTTTGSSSGIAGTRVKFVNCSTTSNNYEIDDNNYMGRITSEIVVVRSSGATDGTTPLSRKMVSSAGAKFETPLCSDWIEFWNNTTGSPITITIPVITDNVTLTDAEAWVESEYLGTSGFPLGNIASDRATDIMATGVAQTADVSSTWTTTGLTTPVKQSLSTSVTPTLKGIIRARVCLAKASTTVYFDPLILTGSRQYQTVAGYVNEPSSGGGGTLPTVVY